MIFRLTVDVDRVPSGPAGTVVVRDVESGEILATENFDFARKQLIRPGSTRKPLVLMELLDSGKLDPKRRLICRRPLRIGACGPIEGTPRTCRSSTRTMPWLIVFPMAADSMPQWSRTPSSRNIGK